MKKLIAVGVITLGMMGSLVGCMAVGAHATSLVSTFFSGTKILGQARQYQIGYAAGVSDAMVTVGGIIADNPTTALGWLTSQSGCFEKDSRSAGELTTWAIQKWQASAGNLNAASTMIDEVCLSVGE